MFESINAINNGSTISAEAVKIDDAEREIFGETLHDVDREYNASSERFLKVYLFHKSRLGLTTRDAVSRLTGINSRYISEIESGKHKPQFKTIKKIADGFGVDVSEFA